MISSKITCQTDGKESTFQICNKEQVIFQMWTYNSFSINQSDDLFLLQAIVPHSFDLSDMERNYSGEVSLALLLLF